jgi:membrane dipeptidase
VDKTGKPLALCLETIDRFYTELDRCSDHIAFAGSSSDIIKNRCEGKISAFLTLEDSGIIDGSPEALRMMYRLGVRLVTLTWNYKNRWVSEYRAVNAVKDLWHMARVSA